MGIGVDQQQKADFFAPLLQPPRHFDRDKPAERIAGKVVRTGGLFLLDRIEIVGSHVFDRFERRLGAIEALRLNAVDSAVGVDQFSKAG